VVLDAALQGTLNFITALKAGTAVAAVQTQTQAATDLGTLQTHLAGGANGTTLAADLQKVVTDATNLNNLSNIAQALNNGLNQVALGALFGANGALNTQDLTTITQDLLIGQFANSLVNTAQQAGTGALGSALGSILGTLPSGQLINITGITNQNGQLTVTGTILGQSFNIPLTLTATPNAANPTCPILNLHLGPIDLDVLGLEVATSEICLNVTAQSGTGNLLGNLLCDVANLLNNGTPLSSVLTSLTNGLPLTTGGTANLTSLTDALNGLLSSALSSVLLGALLGGSSTGTMGAASPADEPPPPSTHQDTPNTCEILDLSLGPVNLNLLGLNVMLNNCANPAGPIVVDVDAIPSTDAGGGLLGDVLCGVSNLLNNNPLGGLGSLGQLEGALAGALAGAL